MWPRWGEGEKDGGERDQILSHSASATFRNGRLGLSSDEGRRELRYGRDLTAHARSSAVMGKFDRIFAFLLLTKTNSKRLTIYWTEKQ